MILIGKLFGLALLAVAVAPGLRAAAAADDGRSTFDKRCAACHDVKGVMLPLMKLPNDAERRSFLDKFLTRHHARDKEERDLIIDYLLRQQSRD